MHKKPENLLLEELAVFVNELTLDRIPDGVLSVAKRCILDTVGVIAAGQASDLGKKANAHAFRNYPAGSATIPGGRGKVHCMGAAFANGISGHAWDFDDTSYTGIMHGSVAVLPAAMAVAEEQQCSGKALLEAFVAGVEVEYALAEYCTHSIYFRGWWTTGVFGAIGAAAAGAKILGLSVAETVNAMAMAATSSTGMKVSFGTDAKPLGVGFAACRGTECAILAQSGLTGPARAIDGKGGFLDLLNNGLSARTGLLLGSRWRLTEPGILFKTYPVCSAAQAAIELTKSLLSKYALDKNSVSSIVCEVPPLVDISLVYHSPESVREAQFSMEFSLGCVLLWNSVELHHLTEDVLNDSSLTGQMNKISMVVPEYLENDASVLERCPEGAGIRITSRDGREFFGFLEKPAGMPGNPLSDDQLVKKFMNCIEFGGFDPAAAEPLPQKILNLQKESEVSAVMALLSDSGSRGNH